MSEVKSESTTTSTDRGSKSQSKTSKNPITSSDFDQKKFAKLDPETQNRINRNQYLHGKDVVTMLKVKIPEYQIVTYVSNKKQKMTLTHGQKHKIKNAGGSDDLIQKLTSKK